MNLDDMRGFESGDVIDAVVIGTGAGGAPILARLAQAGLRVVALEAGENFEPTDHTPDEIAASAIYWTDDRLSSGTTPEVFGANNSGRGVGGSTLHWGAFCPRPQPHELQLQTRTGSGHDWPIAYAELLPYLVEVEQFLAVAGPENYPWDPARRYVQPPPILNGPAQLMARGCHELGIATAAAPAALVSRDHWQPAWGLRHGCVNCGACHQGCRNGAKVTMDTTYLPVAVAYGAEIRDNATAIGLERDSLGHISAVVYRREGREQRQRCANVFLCGGGVESPRLLLNLDLANSSNQVGRNYMAHVATQVWGRFDADVRMNRGYPSSLISEDMSNLMDVDFAGGYLMQSLGVQPVTLATSMARGGQLWGSRLVDLLHNYGRLAGIGINGECLPSPSNRLTLSDEIAEDGLRRAHVNFDQGSNEKALDAHAQATMTSIWQAAGAKDVFALPRSAHTSGTCRMGTDPATAVVNPEGRSFDIDNLWICDHSIFPSAMAANPALTIMALGLRTADRFLTART